MEDHLRIRRSNLAINLGIGANVFLALIKTFFGIVGHSSALLADGINSTSDVLYLFVVRIFIHLSQAPPDEEHPYGHRQLESIAALTIGAFVLTTGVTIFWNAVNRVYDLLTAAETAETVAPVTLAIALLTIALKLFLTFYTRAIGTQTQNPAVLALAQDHRNDIFATGAVLVGLLMNRWGYLWVDPLAGALVALVIIRTAISIVREASSDLMDTLPGKALAQQVEEVLSEVPGVGRVEEIHAHRFGPYYTLNLTIGVDGALSVHQGDAIASQAEKVLYQAIPSLRRVYIHYHPTCAKEGRSDGPEITVREFSPEGSPTED